MLTLRLISIVVVGFLTALTFSAWASEVVVISSTAPNLKPGQIIKPDDPLQIPVGAMVTLVFKSGKTMTVKGPHSSPLGVIGVKGSDRSFLNAIRDVILGPDRYSSDIGGIVLLDESGNILSDEPQRFAQLQSLSRTESLPRAQSLPRAPKSLPRGQSLPRRRTESLPRAPESLPRAQAKPAQATTSKKIVISPWTIDIGGNSGNRCAPADSPVTLSRDWNHKEWFLDFRNLGDRSKSVIRWPAGTNTVDWPAEVTLKDKGKYLTRNNSWTTLAFKSFVLHLVPGDLPSDAHKAVWMAERGCVEQAKRLLAQLR